MSTGIVRLRVDLPTVLVLNYSTRIELEVPLRPSFSLSCKWHIAISTTMKRQGVYIDDILAGYFLRQLQGSPGKTPQGFNATQNHWFPSKRL